MIEIICLDLDGTIKTDVGFIAKDNNVLKTSGLKKEYAFKKRPYCQELCEYIQKNYKLYITTAASKKYAKTCLELMGINDYVDLIIGREDYINKRIRENFVLIDNDSEIADIKVDALTKPYGSKYLQGIWIVDTFDGNEEDKTCLELLEEIKSL